MPKQASKQPVDCHNFEQVLGQWIDDAERNVTAGATSPGVTVPQAFDMAQLDPEKRKKLEAVATTLGKTEAEVAGQLLGAAINEAWYFVVGEPAANGKTWAQVMAEEL